MAFKVIAPMITSQLLKLTATDLIQETALEALLKLTMTQVPSLTDGPPGRRKREIALCFTLCCAECTSLVN